MSRVDLPQQSSAESSTTECPSESIKHLAQGEAALMLVECLMLTLVDQGVLNSHQLEVIVEQALTTKRQMVAEHEHPYIAAVAVGVLARLANSLAANKT